MARYRDEELVSSHCVELERPERAHRGRPRDVPQQRDLAEEVPGPKLAGLAVVELDDGSSCCDHVEVAPRLAA